MMALLILSQLHLADFCFQKIVLPSKSNGSVVSVSKYTKCMLGLRDLKGKGWEVGTQMSILVSIVE